MAIIITYKVERTLYNLPDEKHNISLITTEYRYGNDMLAHLRIGQNLATHLGDRLGDFLTQSIQNELFFHKKIYSERDNKRITRSTFDAKLSHFDMTKTTIEHEILEEFAYTDMRGIPDNVQIIIIDKTDIATATIDFENAKHYQNFACPTWLGRQEE